MGHPQSWSSQQKNKGGPPAPIYTATWGPDGLIWVNDGNGVDVGSGGGPEGIPQLPSMVLLDGALSLCSAPGVPCSVAQSAANKGQQTPRLSWNWNTIKAGAEASWLLFKQLALPSCQSMDQTGDTLDVAGGAAVVYGGLGMLAVPAWPAAATTLAYGGISGGVGVLLNEGAKYHIGCHD